MRRGLLRFRKRKYEKVEMLERRRGDMNEPNVRDGKAKNECPYHAKDEFEVSINDI